MFLTQFIRVRKKPLEYSEKTFRILEPVKKAIIKESSIQGPISIFEECIDIDFDFLFSIFF